MGCRGSTPPAFRSPVTTHVPARYHPCASTAGRSTSPTPCPFLWSVSRLYSADTENGPDVHRASTPSRIRSPLTDIGSEKGDSRRGGGPPPPRTHTGSKKVNARTVRPRTPKRPSSTPPRVKLAPNCSRRSSPRVG